MADHSWWDVGLHHRPYIASRCPPRFPIAFPLGWTWAIGSDDAYVFPCNVSSEQYMKHPLVGFGKGQITWEVLVFRVGFDDLIGVDGIENGLACNRPAVETHVNVIGP